MFNQYTKFKIIGILLGFLAVLNLSCSQDSTDFSFAFLTDIHLQPELNAVEGFQTAIGSVNQLDPDFVITGGDQIMDATAQPFERADKLYELYRQTVESFEMPVYNTMGNHDVFGMNEESGVDPSHPEFYKKMYESRIGDRYYSFDYKGWHFMVLDSIGRGVDRDYVGFIDGEQMQWIAEDLAGIEADTPIVLSTHIPFITVAVQLSSGPTEPNSPGIVITNGREVLLLFLEYNLKLVLQGHLHFLEEINVGDVTFLTGGAVSADWWEGPRGTMEEGYVLIKVKGEEFEWEYIDFGWKAAATDN
jgi:Icc protein